MYKPTEPIRCPKCGAIVKVIAIRFPDIEWKCSMCGESGSIKQGATSGYIQKVGEPDPGVGVTTTNATGDGYNTINAVPSIYSPMTECEICGEEFKFDNRSYICPKCREAVVKIRKLFDGQQSIQILSVDSTVQRTDGTTCKTISFPVEVEEKPNRRI